MNRFNRLVPVAFLVVLCGVTSVLCDEFHHILPTRPVPMMDSVRGLDPELEASYWNNLAQDTLRAKLAPESNNDYAKNVIFFIGDGMSVQTVTAARIFTGEDEKFEFAFDKLPSSGLAKTYCVDAQIADSACTATAYHTGVKTRNAHIGLDARAESMDCKDHANKEYQVEAISQWALDAGMSIGLVTTSKVTDASPSPLYASSSVRWFETDQEMDMVGCNTNQLDDIAEQLVNGKLGKEFQVILGGGRSSFLDKSMVDEEGVPGGRGDGKNLIDRWEQFHKGGKYVWNRDQLLSLDTSKVDYVLGLFEGSYMKFNYENTDLGEPSLEEMVKVAIEILSKNKKGFYLFVEGGRIDHGHHFTLARAALDETRELGKALDMAIKLTNPNETLMVLSADHAHTMTINGYSYRKNDILGLSNILGDDGLPKTTLSYSTGLGAKNNLMPNDNTRVDLTNHNLRDPNYQYPAMVPAEYETHAADDIPVYAVGPHHEKFSGAYEQNAIPYLMAYAARIGPYKGNRK